MIMMMDKTDNGLYFVNISPTWTWKNGDYNLCFIDHVKEIATTICEAFFLFDSQTYLQSLKMIVVILLWNIILNTLMKHYFSSTC